MKIIMNKCNENNENNMKWNEMIIIMKWNEND